MARQYYHQCAQDCLWVDEGIMSQCPHGHGFSRKVRTVVIDPGRRTGNPHFQVMKEFRPYVESFEAGQETVVKNRQHRDELCKVHNKTYDTCKGHGKYYKPAPAADSVTFEEVMKAVKDAPEPERPTIKADDPRRDPGGTGLDAADAVQLPTITDDAVSR